MVDEEKDFINHLDELRKRLISSFIAIAFCSVLAYIFREKIFEILVKPLNQALVFLSPAEAFVTIIKLSIIIGIIMAFPYIIYQIWAFISVIFDKTKKLYVIKYILISLILFYGAITFCYIVVIPIALKFLINVGNLPLIPAITLNNYVNFVMYTLLIFGIIFQFPVILLALINLNIISRETLKKKRIYVILIIFIIAALITPTPDAVTQIILAVPMILLFEITLLIAKFKK